jgi:hypothetical protein
VREIEIEPLVRVGPIRLGCAKNEVLDALGSPDRVSRGTRLLYFGNGLQVHVDQAGTVEFVEVGKCSAVRPLLRKAPILELTADEAMVVAGRYGAIDRENPEFPRICLVPEVELSLWRSALPREDPTATCFESIGCGRAGYFSKAQRP